MWRCLIKRPQRSTDALKKRRNHSLKASANLFTNVVEQKCSLVSAENFWCTNRGYLLPMKVSSFPLRTANSNSEAERELP